MPTIEQIRNAELQLIEAIRASDVPQLDKMIHDSLVCIGPDGNIITKEVDLSAHRNRQMVVDKLVPTFDSIEIMGDVAVSAMTYETSGAIMGEPVSGTLKYLRTWKLCDDGLKVIAAACMRVEP